MQTIQARPCRPPRSLRVGSVGDDRRARHYPYTTTNTTRFPITSTPKLRTAYGPADDVSLRIETGCLFKGTNDRRAGGDVQISSIFRYYRGMRKLRICLGVSHDPIGRSGRIGRSPPDPGRRRVGDAAAFGVRTLESDLGEGRRVSSDLLKKGEVISRSQLCHFCSLKTFCAACARSRSR
jgi:hypothetical protein